jgi:hypothetical protein
MNTLAHTNDSETNKLLHELYNLEIGLELIIIVLCYGSKIQVVPVCVTEPWTENGGITKDWRVVFQQKDTGRYETRPSRGRGI